MGRSKTSLLLGATGFIGRNLAKYLSEQGEQVIGTYFHRSERKHLNSKIRFIYCDATNKQSIERTIRFTRPTSIYYLAAQSSVRHSWQYPVQTIELNFLGGAHLFEILRRTKLKTRVLIFSSATIYGSSYRTGTALNEEACLSPCDPYSLSKMSLDCLARLYGSLYQLDVVVARLANLTGPGQSTTFSIANFASQIAQMEHKTKATTLHVGNLSAKRDYLDVRDGVRAIALLMRHGKSGEAYNVSSGVSRSLKSVLHELLHLSSVKAGKVKMHFQKKLISRDEIPVIRLNSSKLRRLTGWRPLISWDQTLNDILNEWRRK